MRWTKVTLAVGGLFYVALWVLALATKRGHPLIPLVATPLILVILIGGLNGLSSFMGLPSRPQKFKEPPREEEL